MGAVRFLLQMPTDMKVFLFCLAVTANSLPLEVEPAAEPQAEHIINYEDKEAGHGHMQKGVAGEKVEGTLFYRVPEGDTMHLTYMADENGFVAAGDHLPVAPEPLAVEEPVIPVMVQITPEVAEARDQFAATFKEVEMRNAALEDEMMETVDNAVDAAVEEVIAQRKRRDADPVVVPEPEPMTYTLPYQPISYHYQPLSYNYQPYAHAYPYLPYLSYPPAQPLAAKILDTEGAEDMEAVDEAAAEPEPEAGVLGAPLVNLPFRTLSSPILTYPSVVYNPYNSLRFVAPKSVLPAMPLEGEDEPAALTL